jgi:tetratricopeptide (TPR) repeat protein
MTAFRIALVLSLGIILRSQQPTFEVESTRLRELKNWVGLQNLANERLKSRPKDTLAWVLLGISDGNLGKQDDAQVCFQKAIEIDGNNSAAWFNLGLIQLGHKDVAGLTKSLSLLSEINPYLRIKLLDHPGVDELLFKDFIPSKISMGKIKIIHQPKLPPYPIDLRLARIQADLLIEIYVGTDGVPMKVERLWGPKSFASYANEFALAWRFEPYIEDGKPIPFRLRLTMPFRVEGGLPYQALPKEYQPNKAPNHQLNSDPAAHG